MRKMPNLLDRVRIASPCPASWSDMTGDDCVRFCDQCKKNVYNLSAMSRNETESLIREKEGRLCGMYYRRPDGTILTADCPVGLRAIRRRLARLAGGLAAALVFLIGATGLLGADPSRRIGSLRNREPFVSVCNWLFPTPVVTKTAPPILQILGDIAYVNPNPTPAPGATK